MISLLSAPCRPLASRFKEQGFFVLLWNLDYYILLYAQKERFRLLRIIFSFILLFFMITLGACSSTVDAPVPEIAESSPESIEPEIIFAEDFSSGQVSNWDIHIINPDEEAGWSISETEEGLHYEGRQHAFARPPVDGLTDHTINFKFKLLEDASGVLPFNFSFREKTNNGHQRYFVSIGLNEIGLTKQNTASHLTLSPNDFNLIRKLYHPLESNIWYELKVSVLENLILVYLDDQLIIQHLDHDNPLLIGKIAFETLEQSRILIDDIVIVRDYVEYYTDKIAELEKELTGPIINRTTHGIISWDETWQGEMHIVGDIIVEKGYTLTIEPGTTITIAAKQDLHNLCTYEPDLRQGIRGRNEVLPPGYEGIHPGEPFRDEENHIRILVLGTLHAVGTPEKMITFTSDSPNPDIWDWTGLLFENGILSYSKMKYYRVLHPGNGTVVSHNILKNVGECAIGAHNGTAIIEHNQISYAGHELIDIQGGSHIIRYNSLGPNIGTGHCGIVVVNGTSQIYNNQIYQCPHGILLLGGTPSIFDNTISECYQGITYDVPADSFRIEDNTLINNKRDIRRNY